ncbi:hypothetical protein SISNIDRAFT_3335 [Sistotremastrum niveocremeum HHB9708]|uniref:Uncharacterized protein n=1 Tax=Sistotremastrum niveocremeum HHB9708 TaxID=1314777 RepID=A0A165AF02_9AGAM|nr:hypothetical protein SISNIDRAFT_3335 [Sistotremastrum niveocremeum HHB9708]
MTGVKRAAANDVSESSRKTAKTENGESAGKGKVEEGKSSKTPLPPSVFKSKALPLHFNITHTPPSIAVDESAPGTAVDPGFVAHTIAVPSTFSTGSYGWKGSKRMTLELQNSDAKETVTVMLSINAVVVGSKSSKDVDGDAETVDHENQDEDGEQSKEDETETQANDAIDS